MGWRSGGFWRPAALVGGVVVACSGSSGGDGAKGDGGEMMAQSSSGTSTSSSGSQGASSSGSGSGGATSSGGSAGSSSGATPVDAGACLGATALGALGRTHLLVGGSMQDATAAMAPFDLRYLYISGGISDGSGPCTSCLTCTTNSGAKSCQTSNGGSGCSWWGCWQYDKNPPGQYVSGFVSKCAGASPAQIPMITWYQILQASGVAEGSAEVTSAAANQSLMSRYYADYRFMLQQIGQSVAIVHIEPDFWGYAQQYAVTHSMTATTIPAAVASANGTDCSSLPNTIAGMGQCMVAMSHKYAPHALVGLHASQWSTNQNVSLNTSATFDIAGEAKKTATFLATCGSSADLVIVETSDRDAGYYQIVQNKNTWWDPTDKTLPDYAQHLTWVKALTEALGVPALYWQVPLGNSAGTNTNNSYKDNRVDYFFGGSASQVQSGAAVTVPAHWSQLAAAHVVGVAFGAGAGGQTTPDTDGSNLATKTKAYIAAGGQALCQ